MAKRGRGEGTVGRRKSDGLWVGRVSLGFELGKRKRKVVYGKTRRGVAEQVNALLRAKHLGSTIRTSERLTVASYLDSWLAGAKATIRPTTHARYAVLVRRQLIPQLGRIALAKLSPTACASAYAAMLEAGLAPRTVIQARAVLGRALREAEIAGLVARNVARLTRPPRVPHAEMRTLSAEQARTLIEAARKERLGALFTLALASGAREGELLALRWSDVDWARGAIRIQRTLLRTPAGPQFAEPKTAASRRTIALNPSAVETLRRHRITQAEGRFGAGAAWEDGDLMFATEIGTPLDAGNLLRRDYYPLLAHAGLPRVRFHDLRHTAATLLLEAGAHPRVVAERLGHASPSLTLNVYAHVTPTMQKEAAATLERVLGA